MVTWLLLFSVRFCPGEGATVVASKSPKADRPVGIRSENAGTLPRPSSTFIAWLLSFASPQAEYTTLEAHRVSGISQRSGYMKPAFSHAQWRCPRVCATENANHRVDISHFARSDPSSDVLRTRYAPPAADRPAVVAPSDISAALRARAQDGILRLLPSVG